MDQFEVRGVPGAFEVHGIPDAKLAVALDHPAAKRLADLALHKIDLEFAAECLEALNELPPESLLIREALWRSAIVHFCKCFGRSTVRGQLDGTKLYGKTPGAILAFEYFRDLRNKHISHDENPFSDSIPAVILNDGTKPYKVEKIVSLSVTGHSLGEGNWSNLVQLVRVAREAVESEFDAACDRVTLDLESRSYEDLKNMGAATYTVPGADDVGKERKLRGRAKRRKGG